MSWLSSFVGRFSGDPHWPVLGDPRGFVCDSLIVCNFLDCLPTCHVYTILSELVSEVNSYPNLASRICPGALLVELTIGWAVRLGRQTNRRNHQSSSRPSRALPLITNGYWLPVTQCRRTRSGYRVKTRHVKSPRLCGDPSDRGHHPDVNSAPQRRRSPMEKRSSRVIPQVLHLGLQLGGL
jgi:hypothetical protein